MMIRVILSIILFCVVTVETDAQSVSTDSMKNDTIVKKESLWKRLNRKLSNMYFTSKYDTNYLARYGERYMVEIRPAHQEEYHRRFGGELLRHCRFAVA